MNRPRFSRLSLALLLLWGVTGCGTDATSASGDAAVGCIAGATRACQCADGRSGAQTCSPTGDPWTDCVCDGTQPDAGQTDGLVSVDTAVGPTPDAAGPNPDAAGATPDAAGATPAPDAAADPDARRPPPPPPDGGNVRPPRDGGGGAGGGGGGGGPVLCTVEADCQADGACPPEAGQGCGCKVNPQGEGHCVPHCTVDADCPVDPARPLVCHHDGFCGPDNGGGQTDAVAPPPPLSDAAMPPPPPTDAVMPPPPGDALAPPPPPSDAVLPPPADASAPPPHGPVVCTMDVDCSAAGACPADAPLGCGCKIAPDGTGHCVAHCGTDADCPVQPNKVFVCRGDGYCAQSP